MNEPLSYGSPSTEGPCERCQSDGLMFGLFWHRERVTLREERVCRPCLDEAIAALPKVPAPPPSVLPFVDALLDLDPVAAERAIALYQERRP